LISQLHPQTLLKRPGNTVLVNRARGKYLTTPIAASLLLLVSVLTDSC
jgi:hypothetical protein